MTKYAVPCLTHRGSMPMNGKFLVDTNVIIRLLRSDERAIELFNQAESICIPVVVAGELFYGAEKSTRQQANARIFSEFISQYEVIEVDTAIAQKYGAVKAELKKLGLAIPENDLWIAATAIARQYTLISFDGHFSRINGLRVVA